MSVQEQLLLHAVTMALIVMVLITTRTRLTRVEKVIRDLRPGWYIKLAKGLAGQPPTSPNGGPDQ